MTKTTDLCYFVEYAGTNYYEGTAADCLKFARAAKKAIFKAHEKNETVVLEYPNEYGDTAKYEFYPDDTSLYVQMYSVDIDEI